MRSRLCAFVIPYYQGGMYIQPCVKSIVENGVEAESIYVVNNDCGSGNCIHELMSFEKLNIIRTVPRIGFGRACNIGSQRAIADGYKYVVIVNQDLVFCSGSISKLIGFMESEVDCAVCAPLNVMYETRKLEPFYVKHYLSECPDVITDILSGKRLAGYNVDNVMGSCMVIRSEVISYYGLFDELYFMYYEDVDMCRRFRRCGLRMALCVEAAVAHAHSHTNDNKRGAMYECERQSKYIFVLKDVSRPFVECIGKVLFEMVRDYMACVVRGKVCVWVRRMVGDFRLWASVVRIVRSRRREECLTERRVCVVGKNEYV